MSHNFLQSNSNTRYTINYKLLCILHINFDVLSIIVFLLGWDVMLYLLMSAVKDVVEI